jgi:uncharacterized ferredoxin-like protein
MEHQVLEEDIEKLIEHEISDKEKLLCRNCNGKIKDKGFLLVDLKADRVITTYCEKCATEFRKEELIKHRKDVY